MRVQEFLHLRQAIPLVEMLNPGVPIGYEYSATLAFLEKKMPRRSKRKASAMATKKNSELASTTAAAASATTVGETVQDNPKDDTAEVVYLSDDEDSLHGPCNVRPVGADENPRFVHV